MIGMTRGFRLQLALLGLLSSPALGNAQVCGRGLVLESAELQGITSASPGRVGPVQQLRWPPTMWRDSMWVRVVLFNDTPTLLRGARLLFDVRGVAASLGHFESPEDSLLVVRPGPGGVVPLPATRSQAVDVGSLRARERRQVDVPLRLSEVFPWFTDTLQAQVLPVAVEYSVIAAILGTPTTTCIDDLRDNYLATQVPLSYAY